MRIQVEIAPGELFDKITILEIKLEKITDENKLIHIKNEWLILRTSANELLEEQIEQQKPNTKSKKLSDLTEQLKKINQQIWDIEDDIRDCERRGQFGGKFVQLARSVYLTNDKRAELKKEISILFDSDIMEEKSYTEYANIPKAPKQDHVKECNQLIKEHSERNNG